MKKIELITFDLDGTLLRSDGTVSEYTYKVLKKAKEAGIKIYPNSGRAPYVADMIASTIDGVNYVGATNGSIIFKEDTKEIIYSKPLNKETVLKIYNFTKNFERKTSFIANGYHVTDDGIKDIEIKRFISYTPTKEHVELLEYVSKHSIEDFIKNDKHNIYKINVPCLEESSERASLVEYLKELGDINGVVSMSGIIELNSNEADKGKSLNFVANKYGIKLENTMAFGDAENDEPMLETAGVGVAVKNGTDSLKKKADIICETNDEDGVAKTINKLLFE